MEEDGKTIIFITHNVAEAVLISQRIFVMATNPGRIVKAITVDLPAERTVGMTEDPGSWNMRMRSRR